MIQSHIKTHIKMMRTAEDLKTNNLYAEQVIGKVLNMTKETKKYI